MLPLHCAPCEPRQDLHTAAPGGPSAEKSPTKPSPQAHSSMLVLPVSSVKELIGQAVQEKPVLAKGW